MAQKLTQDEDTLSEVNVIPLADLSLVLLIILMVISPMITQALIHVNAAKAQKAETQEELATPEIPVVVSFQPAALKLNGTPMGSEIEFVKRLSAILATRRDKAVYLTASPKVLHGKVIRVMDLIQSNGASNLVMLKWDGGREGV